MLTIFISKFIPNYLLVVTITVMDSSYELGLSPAPESLWKVYVLSAARLGLYTDYTQTTHKGAIYPDTM